MTIASDDPDREEDRLADRELARVAGRAGRLVQRDDRRDHEPDRREREQRVERQAQAGGDAGGRRLVHREVAAPAAQALGSCVVVLGEHPAGDRRRDGGAEAALLDGHRDDDRALASPGRRRCTRTGRLLAVARRRAGLAEDREGGVVPAGEDVVRRAAGLARREPQALAHGVEVALVDLHLALGLALDALDELAGRGSRSRGRGAAGRSCRRWRSRRRRSPSAAATPGRRPGRSRG